MLGEERRSVLIAGAIVAILLGFVAALRGQLDWIFLLTASVAVAAATSLTRFGRPHRRTEAPPPASGRPAIAEALLAKIPDPVILVDRRAVVIEANPAARALLPALKLRDPLSFALRDPDVLDGVEQVLRSGRGLTTSYATRGTTERAFEVQIGALPMSEPDGGLSNVVLFLRDVTSAHRLESMRVDFVAHASHELRTPLASLLGFVETLQGPARNDGAARERFLGIMATQARRMARLVDDLLSLSRIELREHVAPTQALDLGDLARQMMELQTPLAQERGATLTLTTQDPAYPITGDRDDLLRVIENVIENALKYGGGRVSVTLSRRIDPQGRGGLIELAVHDDGPGIPAVHLPRLTERFYRVDTAQSRKQGGTGLGLAIVKHSLNRHRGRLTIESEPEKGTTMRVWLPERESRTRPKAKAAVGEAETQVRSR